DFHRASDVRPVAVGAGNQVDLAVAGFFEEGFGVLPRVDDDDTVLVDLDDPGVGDDRVLFAVGLEGSCHFAPLDGQVAAVGAGVRSLLRVFDGGHGGVRLGLTLLLGLPLPEHVPPLRFAYD